jgi:glycine oxidase
MRAVDVAVVGGGVIGASVACALARGGASVVLIERDDPGAHASRAAAGMLAPITESFGRGPIFTLGLESLSLLERDLDALRELSGVDPELIRSGILRVAREAETASLRAHAAALADFDCAWVEGSELRKRDARLAPELAGALFSPREGHVDAYLLTRAYAGAAVRRGAQIQRDTEALGLLREGDRITGVRTSAGELHAHDVILCTGAWARHASDWLGRAIPVDPVKGQMLALDGSEPHGGPILWGEGAYIVPRRNGQLRIGATVEHVGFDARPTAAGVATLLAGAFAIAPALRSCAFVETWAGLRPGTRDHLPLIGRVPGLAGAWLAVGHHRNGILLSALTGRALAAELLDGARWPGLDAFDPARASLQNPDRAERAPGRTT